MEFTEDEIYRNMCTKSKELQKLFKKKDGDYIIGYKTYWKSVDINTKKKITELQGIFRLDPYNYVSIVNKELAFWLPRLDQLQSLIKRLYIIQIQKFDDDYCMLVYFNQYHTNYKDPVYVFEGKSMEQLFLKFWMKDKYKKQWNGSEWKKVNV